jgi:hypothetical protein
VNATELHFYFRSINIRLKVKGVEMVLLFSGIGGRSMGSYRCTGDREGLLSGTLSLRPYTINRRSYIE